MAWREEVAIVKRASYAGEEYWGRPVPGFGAAEPLIWIVGLAPAAHGANRTGRMFTGDRSGDWLYASLHRVGLAAKETSTRRGDGQRLDHVRITAAVHCAPPGNQPTPAERHECAHWLAAELGIIEPTVRVIVALGAIAWAAALGVLREVGWDVERASFGHGASTNATSPSGREVLVVASYHPSQQNTFTGRLTPAMMDEVFAQAHALAATRSTPGAPAERSTGSSAGSAASR